jgi:hypothetical protein
LDRTITISDINDFGNIHYSIPLTGGCGAVNATGTITVTPTPPGCFINTNIVYQHCINKYYSTQQLEQQE